MRVGALRATVENIFVYEGVPGHEVIFIYEVTPEDAGFFSIEAPRRLDGVASRIGWHHPQEVALEGCPLYPAAFGELLSP